MESKFIIALLHLFITLAVSPLCVGIINRVKSIFAGRKGVPVLQLYFDIYKLLKKGTVYSKSTSFLFRLIPFILFITTIIAGAFLPLAGYPIVSFWGDAILFVYIFALGRFLIIISAMDTGSSFEGMGASREAVFGAFAELTVFVVIMSLFVFTGFMSLEKSLLLNEGYLRTDPALILLFCAFIFILLTENSRMPVDDPNTHLELTMVHEVMILDYSGPDLGIILYVSSIKLFIFMLFAIMLIFPNTNLNLWQNAGLNLLKVLGMSVAIGVIESVTTRIRLIKIPQMLIASFVISIFALISAIYARGFL